MQTSMTMQDQLPANLADFDMSAFSEFQQEIAPGEPVVRFIKHKWVFQNTDDKVKLDVGQELVGNPWKMQRGWLRFEHDDKSIKVAERRLGFVADVYRPESRDVLGYDDQSKWRIVEGNPQDPWTETVQFPAILVGEKGNYQVMVAGTSYSWKRCIGNFINQWKAQMVSNQGKAPVIKLGITEYTNQHGDQQAPVLTIDRWADPTKVECSEPEPPKPQERKQSTF